MLERPRWLSHFRPMSKRVLIVVNTTDFNPQCVLSRVPNTDLIIAADGASNKLPSEVRPHIICGDFDSIDELARRRDLPDTRFVKSECQETNDLEKCVQLALSEGATSIAISCAVGGRIDQTFVTFSILERYHRELEVVLYDDNRSCRVVSVDDSANGVCQIATLAGDTVSLVPRGDGAQVSLANTQWPLTRERLGAGSRGVSNRATAETVVLTVHEGVVFFFHEYQTKKSGCGSQDGTSG